MRAELEERQAAMRERQTVENHLHEAVHRLNSDLEEIGKLLEGSTLLKPESDQQRQRIAELLANTNISLNLLGQHRFALAMAAGLSGQSLAEINDRPILKEAANSDSLQEE